MNRRFPLARLVWALLLLALVTLSIAWFAGAFTTKIPPDRVAGPPATPPPGASFIRVTATEREQFEAAIGTVRAVRETDVAARIIAKVEEVRVKAGQKVARGDALIVLDDTDLRSRVGQAGQAVEAAASQANQAELELGRNRELFEKKILSGNDWDRTQNQARQAKAALQRAKEALKEAETNLSFATIRAPIDGVVVDRKINVGDLAAPGRVLLSLYDPRRMQLWARVRETLAAKLKPGTAVTVKIDVLDKPCQGRVDEVVPSSDVGSRTFLVKVSGPCPPGIYTGMYGKLLLAMGTRPEIRLPGAAIGRVGQLALVMVKGDDGSLQRRYVRTGGDPEEGLVRVVAGLAPGEMVLARYTDAGN